MSSMPYARVTKSTAKTASITDRSVCWVIFSTCFSLSDRSDFICSSCLDTVLDVVYTTDRIHHRFSRQYNQLCKLTAHVAGNKFAPTKNFQSSSSFSLNQATWPIHKHTLTYRQNKQKKSIIKHSESHKNADGLTHRSSFTRSLLCLLQTYRKDFL